MQHSQPLRPFNKLLDFVFYLNEGLLLDSEVRNLEVVLNLPLSEPDFALLLRHHLHFVGQHGFVGVGVNELDCLLAYHSVHGLLDFLVLHRCLQFLFREVCPRLQLVNQSDLDLLHDAANLALAQLCGQTYRVVPAVDQFVSFHVLRHHHIVKFLWVLVGQVVGQRSALWLHQG
jgi:hypothetical protein